MGKERNGGGDNGGPGDTPPPVDSRTARRRQDPIGRRLRKMYTDVVDESVPDEFLSFLEEADIRQSASADRSQPAVSDVPSSPNGDATQPER
jgi:hypothetical protein